MAIRAEVQNGMDVVILQGPNITPYLFAKQKVEHEALMKEAWGERCEDQFSFCAICAAWNAFDQYWRLMADVQDLCNED